MEVVKPPSKGLLRWVKRAWRQLKREQLTPGRFGVAVGLGLFFGLSPFWGFQMITAQVLAYFLKLNKLAVAAAVSISAPPFLPFEVLLSVQLGQRILYGTWSGLTLEMVQQTGAKELAKYYGSSFAVGALALGLIVSIPAGFFAAWRLKRVQARQRPELTLESLEALDDALPALPRRHALYVAWKVRLDPIYPMVLPHLIGRREVLDLGAGPGILAFFLRQTTPVTKLRCVEWDEKKVAMARLLNGATLDIVTADARTIDIGTPDTIVMLDVMHYVPVEEQRAWLGRVAAALPPGGRIVLRELDFDAGETATKVEEQAVKGGWNKGQGVYPWPITDMVKHIEALGFDVTRTPAGRWLFRANSLLIATKPPALVEPGAPRARTSADQPSRP